MSINKFLGKLTVNEPTGELENIVRELRQLAQHTRLSEVPKDQDDLSVWKTLRLDQVFRIHEKSTLVRLVELVHEIDALIAMADTTTEKGFTLPDLIDGPVSVIADGLIHPLIPEPIANSIALDQEQRLLFLTGPNMAGKTTFIRSFATAIYLAHLGMGVPARSFKFTPVECLFSSISITDDLAAGISYFKAEALRVKAIADAVSRNQRVIAVLDEPFKGTNVKDAYDASLAIIERLATRRDCLFVFSSHLIELGENMSNTDHIDCHYFEAEDQESSLIFSYQMKPGISNQRLGMRVLKQERVFELLDKD